MDKIVQKMTQLHNEWVIRKARSQLKTERFTLISQNCIGGVFYHDMGLQFQSPTINLFFSAEDFIRFAEQLEHYLSVPVEVFPGEEYPLGRLEDLTIRFMHYHSCEEAELSWNKRVKRVLPDRVVVCCTDRDGFNDDLYARWKNLRYPKVLFSAKKRDSEDCVSFPEYAERGCVPDLIPRREFYRGGVLMKAVNGFSRQE